MDVRCEKCLTEYEFDDARVTEAGVTVKCTTCGHVFKVKKPGAAALPPMPQADEFAPEASQIDRVREWKIRQPNGNIFTCRELTTLQKWIVERKVSRDDEISLSGDAWKRLGDIPELAGFFLVVDQANKAQLLEQQMRTGPSAGHAPTIMSAPPAPQRPTTGGYQMGSPPPRAQHEPTWLQPPPDDSYEDDLKAIKKRGPGLWLGVLLVLVAGGGGAYFYLHSQGMFGGVAPQQASGARGTAALPSKGPSTATSTPTQVAPPTPPSTGSAAAVDSGPAAIDAGHGVVDAGHEMLDAGHGVPDAGPAIVDAGAPLKTTGGAPGPVAVAKPTTGGAAPHPKTFEGLMAEGARFEQRGRAQAALSAYQQAIELEPGSAEAWSGKAQALVDLENYPGAEDAYRRALGIAPRFSDAEFGLAEALKFQGKKADAIKQYKKFIADHPDDTENVGIAKRAIGELSD